MRIVQLANFYSPTSGGLGTMLRSLARGYVDAGHEVVRVVPGPTGREWHDGTSTVIEIAAPPLGGTGYRMIRSAGHTERVLQALRPAAIELSDKATLVKPAHAQRRHGARVVLISHERLDAILRARIPEQVPLERMANWWNRRLARRVDAIVCASAFAAEEFDRIGAPHVHRIPLGIDLDAFHHSPVDRARTDGTIRLGMVSRLSLEKRPELAIETVRALVQRGVSVRLDIAGDGPMLTELTALADGLPVRFLGHLGGRADVVSLLQQADVTLAPCGVETFGLAALESMACGTPVVAANTGGLRELVAPGTGEVAEPDGNSFADAVMRLCGGDPCATARTARAQAERFPREATVAGMLRVLSGDSSDAMSQTVGVSAR
jgi:alpha-1,6-mannosyltransferase